MAWDIIEEDFADLTDWTDTDWGSGVSEISPAGQLHQDSINSDTVNNGGRIYQDTGTLSGDFTVEFKVKFDRALQSGDGSMLFKFLGAQQQIWTKISSTAMNIYGGAYSTGITKTWSLDTWYTIRIIFHTSQGLADFYLDGVEQNTDVDCSYFGASDGTVYIMGSGDGATRQEWHFDYIYIGAGQQVPTTTSIKKVSSVAYASIKKISGVAIASVKKIAGVE